MKKQSTLIAGVIFVVMVAVIIICNASGVAFASTFWALVPPLVAIVLALITKEAYSSLFIGIVLGALMNSQCSFLGTVDNVAINDINRGYLYDPALQPAGFRVYNPQHDSFLTERP